MNWPELAEAHFKREKNRRAKLEAKAGGEKGGGNSTNSLNSTVTNSTSSSNSNSKSTKDKKKKSKKTKSKKSALEDLFGDSASDLGSDGKYQKKNHQKDVHVGSRRETPGYRRG